MLQADFEGKGIVVIGKTSGVDRAVVLMAAQRGASVVFCGRQGSEEAEVIAAARLAGAAGQVCFVPINLASEADIEHLFDQGGISGIAFQDDAVRDQVGLPHTEANLVAIEGLPAILLDNVRMGLEQRDHLFLGRNLLLVEHSAARLIHDPMGRGYDSHQIIAKSYQIGGCRVLEKMDHVARTADYLLGDLEQIRVDPFSDLHTLGILNGQHLALGLAGVIGKGEMQSFFIPDLSEDPSDNPHRIPQ